MTRRYQTAASNTPGDMSQGQHPEIKETRASAGTARVSTFSQKPIRPPPAEERARRSKAKVNPSLAPAWAASHGVQGLYANSQRSSTRQPTGLPVSWNAKPSRAKPCRANKPPHHGEPIGCVSSPKGNHQLSGKGFRYA